MNLMALPYKLPDWQNRSTENSYKFILCLCHYVKLAQ